MRIDESAPLDVIFTDVRAIGGCADVSVKHGWGGPSLRFCEGGDFTLFGLCFACARFQKVSEGG